jgi:replicative DNA helicase
MSVEPPSNQDAEAAVLGAILLAPTALNAAVDAQLSPASFYALKHERVFAAMLRLHDRSEPIDPTTVAAEVEDVDAGYVHSLQTRCDSVGRAAAYARIVKRAEHARVVVEVARELQEAALAGDTDRIAEAEGRLAVRDTGKVRVTLEARQEALADHPERKVDTLPWPFHKMDELTGGMWPGHLTLLIGPSTHGKSVLGDQILEKAVKHNARCCAYLTEMTPLERDLRFIARRADIPLTRLLHGELQGDLEHRRYVKALQQLPFEIQPAGTWKVEEVGRDIRRRRWDVAMVDLFNAISGRETKDIDESVARLAGIANDTGCHIIACQHLNRSRLTGAGITYPPEPSQGDIRGSGALFDLSTNVLSVYRREREIDGEPTGEPGEDAVIRFLKVKNGIPGRIDVRFNGPRMRFELPREPGVVGTVAA